MIDIVTEQKAKRLPGLIEVHSNKYHAKSRAKDIAELKCERERRAQPLLISRKDGRRTGYLPCQWIPVLDDPKVRGSVIVHP